MKRICVALVGDFNEKIHTLVALSNAIEHCRKHLNFLLETTWVPTTWLPREGFDRNTYQGCWIVPGSPYKDDESVLDTIKWARENDFPLLGTCGGFQFMILEYTRNVLQNANAFHEETDPQATSPVISRLSCSLKGLQEEVLITDKSSWLYKVLKTEKITGNFYCSYGFNDIYRHEFKDPFCFTANSIEGEMRACELKTHRFFNGTLFQPSLDSTVDHPNPLLLDFFRSVAAW
jgi:CTP synthase (UTP-ammonia lyase)